MFFSPLRPPSFFPDLILPFCLFRNSRKLVKLVSSDGPLDYWHQRFHIFSHLFGSFHSVRTERLPAPQKLLYMVYEHASLGCSCLQLVALNCTNLQVVALRTRESKRFQHHKTPSTSCHLSSLRFLRLLMLKIRPLVLGPATHHSIAPSLRLDPHPHLYMVYEHVLPGRGSSRPIALHRG
jgi:hypothetical protein